MKISRKFTMMMGMCAVLILGIATIASAAPKVSMTVLNLPNAYGDIVIVRGTNVEVDLNVYDPLNESSNQDIIRLIRITDGAIVSEQRRGNELTGTRSLATQKTLVNPVLGELQVQYVSSVTDQVIATSDKNIFLVDNQAIVELINRTSALEDSVTHLEGLIQALQNQIDNSPYSPQSCPADQFVTGFDAVGNIACAGLPSNTLLAYYTFEGNVLDASGNGYDGTVGGAEAYGTGHSGQAFSFNGATYISTTLDIDVSVQPQLTMGAWIYPIGIFDGQILTHDDQGFDRSLLYSSAYLNPPALIAYDGRDGGSTWFTVPAGTGWQFVAVVYDQDKQTVTLYVDGNAVTKEGQILGPSVNKFRMGNNESNGMEFFNGLVDDVFVVSGALSIAELDQIRLNGVQSMFP